MPERSLRKEAAPDWSIYQSLESRNLPTTIREAGGEKDNIDIGKGVVKT